MAVGRRTLRKLVGQAHQQIMDRCPSSVSPQVSARNIHLYTLTGARILPCRYKLRAFLLRSCLFVPWNIEPDTE